MAQVVQRVMQVKGFRDWMCVGGVRQKEGEEKVGWKKSFLFLDNMEIESSGL